MTKKLHTLPHGVSPDGAHMTEADVDVYERVISENAAAVLELVRPRDVAILHDPQTAGLVRALKARSVHVI